MIELIDVKKRFKNQDKWITDGVSLFVPSGKCLCLIGMSGEGKSVLLKQIAGLIKPNSGSIVIDGVPITKFFDSDINELFGRCGYVFQFAALLDSLTIYENIALPLKERKKPSDEIRDIVVSSLDAVNLNIEILNKYPSEVSGGMRKRIGLARTLVTNPKIILYDEPTSGLDPINTEIIHELMKKTHEKRNITAIVVSHDVKIFDYVDLVAFLYRGKIEYIGDANNIWDCQDSFVYQFIRGLSEGPIQ
jgi:phospholipid/cholesterol/gamma-HCH transport system ATP-binding protein